MATFKLSEKVKGFKLGKKTSPSFEYHTASGHVAIDLRTCTQVEAQRAFDAGVRHLVKESKPTPPKEEVDSTK